MAGKIPSTIRTSAAKVTTIRTRLPTVAREQMPTRQDNAIQQHSVESSAPARAFPRVTSGHTTLQQITFPASSAVNIKHLLGRAYVGWHPHSAKQAPAVLYDTTATAGLDANKWLQLTNGSGSQFVCDVDVW